MSCTGTEAELLAGRKLFFDAYATATAWVRGHTDTEIMMAAAETMRYEPEPIAARSHTTTDEVRHLGAQYSAGSLTFSRYTTTKMALKLASSITNLRPDLDPTGKGYIEDVTADEPDRGVAPTRRKQLHPFAALLVARRLRLQCIFGRHAPTIEPAQPGFREIRQPCQIGSG